MFQVRRDIMSINYDWIDWRDHSFLIKEIEFISINIVLNKTGEVGIQLEILCLARGSMAHLIRKRITYGDECRNICRYYDDK